MKRHTFRVLRVIARDSVERRRSMGPRQSLASVASLCALHSACGSTPLPERNSKPEPPGAPLSAVAAPRRGPPASPKPAWCPKPSPRPCSKDGWCWENPAPHGIFFEDAWGDAARLVAIGGRSMVAIRTRAETSWQFVDAGNVPAIEKLYGEGDDIYFAGRKGTLLRYRAGCFETIDVPTDADLRGVWTDGHVLLVIGGRRLHMFRDGAWSDVKLPEEFHIHSLWARSPDDIFLGDGASKLYHYENGSWSVDSRGIHNGWRSIFGTAQGGVFAVGVSQVALYDRASWRSLYPSDSSGRASWLDVWSAGPGHALAVSRSGTMAWLEGRRVEPPAIGGLGWGAVWGESPTSITVLGSHVLRLNGNRWSVEHTPVGDRTYVKGIGGSDDAHVYAVGNAGTIWRRSADASFRVVRASGKEGDYLNDVWVRRPDDVWVVGSNQNLLQWDGKDWHQRATAETPHLDAVWGHDADLAYAVGSRRRKVLSDILRYEGGDWKPVPNVPEGYWFDVWGSGPLDVYASGNGGLIHYDGKSWQRVEGAKQAFTQAEGEQNYFNASRVWGSGPNDVFVSMSNGGVLHFDGSAWSYTAPAKIHLRYKLPGDGGVDEVAGRGAEVWGVSNHGLIYRYDGVAWHHESSATDTQFSGVWVSDKAVYAVGNGGAILRRPLEAR